MHYLRYGLRALFARIENQYDRAFSPAWNPFYQLGALGWFFYWIVAASGIYIYAFFDTGITQAYESVEAITRTQWYAGGIMRSLHRYASDALVVVVLLHLAREFALDRMRGHRWFAWITGVPLLWFIYACGVTGYWLVWDMLAQYVAIAMTEWLDALPLFGQSIAANFSSSENLSARFFSLMVYIHIAVPLFMLFMMWLHIQRQAQAVTQPCRGLAAGTLISLVVLSIVYPAVSQEPANLNAVPATVNLDWFYLAMFPLLDSIPGGRVWLLVAAGTIILLLLPWLPPKRSTATAAVDLENCNGCMRCYDDCPFSAITMVPRSDGRAYELEATVNATNCVSCGICVGACPTATPFRRTQALSAGIELPDRPVSKLREQTIDRAEKLSGDARVIVFACEQARAAEKLDRDNVGVITLPCVGMLPPSFVDFIISRRMADGIMISGCREGDCHFRLGADWTRQRLGRERDPYLRRRVPTERIAVCWADDTQSARRETALTDLQRRIAQLPPIPPPRLENSQRQRESEAAHRA